MFIMSCLWGVPGDMSRRKLDFRNALYLAGKTLRLSTLCNCMTL